MSAHRTTALVRAGIVSDTAHAAVSPPLYLSANFAFAGFDSKRPYDYTRSGNPTRDELGTALAELEGGAGAVITSSGMAAVSLVLQLLDPSDLVVLPHDCYGGTWRIVDALARKGHFRVAVVDQGSMCSAGAHQFQPGGEGPPVSFSGRALESFARELDHTSYGEYLLHILQHEC